MINELNEISIKSSEGRLLMAALAKLTTESQTDKTPDEVIGQLNLLANEMFVEEQELPQQKTLYTEEQVRFTICKSFLLGVDRGEYSKDFEDRMIESLKQPKKD
jgi:hypothetical protein